LEYIGAVDQRRVEYNQYFKKNEKIPVPFNLANRSDILKFTSAPLTSQIEIIGRLRAELFITSNCTDTDFTAKLIDVYPDGREMWVAEGILKTRSREGYNNSVFMTPGNVYDLEIDMWSTAYRFTEGHQLRLSISSSNWNKFAVNTNTGGPITITYPEELKSGEFYYANNTVLAGVNGSLSCLWLPRTN
jgi:putative CocE/NonD family hydrolase